MAKQSGNKEKLIQAGLSLLSQKPAEEISMDEIAEKAGVTKPMVYYYFGNKAGFYKYLVEYIEELVSTLINESIKSSTNFRGIISYIITKRIELTINQPDLSNAIRIIATTHTIAGVQARSRLISKFSNLIPIFEKAKNTGEIRADADLHITMALTNSLLDGALRIHGQDFFKKINSSEFANGLTSLIFDGIGTGKRQ